MRIIIETEDKDTISTSQAKKAELGTTSEAANAGAPSDSLVQAVSESIATATTSSFNDLTREGTDAGAAPAELLEILNSAPPPKRAYQH